MNFATGVEASLKGKLVWVTGGAGHLGAPITAALDAAGATVLCLELGDRAEKLVRGRALERVVPVSLDLTDSTLRHQLVADLLRRYGAPHGLVHLAFVSSAGKRLEEISPAEMDRTLTGAVTPAFDIGRTVAAAMAQHGRGSVVLFSSMYGVVSPDPGIYAAPLAPNPIDYGVSKAGMIQMCRYMAVHFGRRGVRFNCIAPGPFPNPDIQQNHPDFITRLNEKTALGRIGSNGEIVGPTLFLLSDAASYVTGHTLVVDGGWTAW